MTMFEEALSVLEEKVLPCTSGDWNTAVQVGITAVKLQIPQKPIGEHYAHMRCPWCGHRIPSGAGSSSRRRDNWCNYCGQKIDWEGVKI